MPLHVSKDAGVARIVLDRPNALNALSPALLRDLIDLCGSLRDDTSVRVVRIEGEGSHFSAGADLPAFLVELTGEAAQETADLGRLAADTVAELPQICIAAIRGHCIGGGVVLAAACDLRVAASDARFLVPELDAGIPLAWGGIGRLVRLVGETVASDWVLSCRPFSAEEALRTGLVSRILDPELFSEEVDALATSIADKPASVLRTTKRQLTELRAGTFDATTDAKALRDALGDPEVIQRATAYMSQFKR